MFARLTLVSAVIAELIHQTIIVFVSAFPFAVIKGQIVAVRFMETNRARAVCSGLYRSWIIPIDTVLLLGNLLAPHG